MTTHSILHAQRMAQHREAIGEIEGNPSHFAEGGEVMYADPPPEPAYVQQYNAPRPVQSKQDDADGLLPDFRQPGIVNTRPSANRMRVLPNGTIQLY